MAQITNSNDLSTQLGIFSIFLGLMLLFWGIVFGTNAAVTGQFNAEAEAIATLTKTIALVIGGGTLFIGGVLLLHLPQKVGSD